MQHPPTPEDTITIKGVAYAVSDLDQQVRANLQRVQDLYDRKMAIAQEHVELSYLIELYEKAIEAAVTPEPTTH